MRITKVYTKTGDQGTTRLVGGEEVSKDSVRVEAYGSVDELNAHIGLLRTIAIGSTHPSDSVIEEELERIQHDLFDLGALLATPPASEYQPQGVSSTATERLEGSLDSMNHDLPPLKDFVLPGGGQLGAHFHIARTVCRRAERQAVSLCHAEPQTGNDAIVYLNRLSDWLFVAGRWAAQQRGERELIWRHDLPR